jgi:cell wall-associated NlpC family hydrolase
MRRCARFLSLIAAGLFAVLFVSVPSGAASAPHNPTGHLDTFRVSGVTVSFSGWSADPDVAGTVRIVVAVDNTPTLSVLANQSRPDVARALPVYGANRGFSGSFNLQPGLHKICITAGDLAAGSDTAFLCTTQLAQVPANQFAVANAAPAVSTVATARPIGSFESYSYGGGLLWFKGWTIDPNTAAATQIDVTINGQSYGSAVANVYRADVLKAHPGYWWYHGFALTVQARLAPGNYELCVVAVNTAAGGNSILPCKIMTIRPATPPAELNLGTADQAADALQARAVATHAASPAVFPAGATSAARIAIATRALLSQAAGLTVAPPAQAGIPAFTKGGTVKVVDEQAVMGASPALGSYPAAKTGGRPGAIRSLSYFNGDSFPAPGGAGNGIVGAAAVLAANGTTVDPVIPGYPAGATRLRAQVALDTALSHLGDPYVWAAGGPTTFDCSGLVQFAYAAAGISLTHYTGTQALQGVRVMPNQLLPGDLLLFGADLHHVGLYLGGGYMINAPYTGAYVRVDRVSDFGDFTLAVRP